MATPKTELINEDDYVAWAQDKLKVDFDSEDNKTAYSLNVNAAKTAVQEAGFWLDLQSQLTATASRYQEQFKADLFLERSPQFALLKKSYTSVVNKTFRHNVIWNRNWPNPPKGDWVTPDNLYNKIDDLLRTTIICKFFDGPEFLAKDLCGFGSGKNIKVEHRPLHRKEGYYAHHVYATLPMKLAAAEGKLKSYDFRVEFQIMTITQDLLRKLTHPYYSEERSHAARDPESPWQWAHRTNKFRARYLSHTLHLLEALILDIRDSGDEK